MYVGRPGNMSNLGQVKSAMLWTWVAAPGAPLTTLAPPAATPAAATPVAVAPGPPRTGTGLAPNHGFFQIDQRLALGWTGLAALTLSVLALGMYRGTRRRD